MIYHGATSYREMDTFNDLGVTVAQTIEDLRDVDFDSIAVTGVSGMSVGFPVAAQMGKRIAVLRKPNEQNHAGGEAWAGYAGLTGRVIIVDDFVSGGETWNRLADALADYDFEPVELVGTYLYRDRQYTPTTVRIEGDLGPVRSERYDFEPDDFEDTDHDWSF